MCVKFSTDDYITVNESSFILRVVPSYPLSCLLVESLYSYPLSCLLVQSLCSYPLSCLLVQSLCSYPLSCLLVQSLCSNPLSCLLVQSLCSYPLSWLLACPRSMFLSTVLFACSKSMFLSIVLFRRWDTADTEINVHFADNPEPSKVVSPKPGVGQSIVMNASSTERSSAFLMSVFNVADSLNFITLQSSPKIKWLVKLE